MLATLQPATEMASPIPPATMPSVVPVRFWDGDRVEDWEEPRSGWALRRGPDGVWRPLQRAGSYALPPSRDVQFPTVFDDDAIRRYLGRPGAAETIRFAPRSFATTEPLPGRLVVDWADLDTLLGMGLGAGGAIPFVASFGPCRGFWSLRDLAAERGGEEAAEHVDPAVSLEQMRDALAVMLEEHRAEVSFHRPAGRLYARYQTYGAYAEGEKERIQVRTFVYVLTGGR
ncbi:hypothetical protein HCJ76_44145 [Streptomyces sp. MC1]|uniref:hypothetical protein n=1 Tax=Streptomyces sp. MC1 TaxID=295105 RepID=UPI0018CAAB8D|nr:hypothetical protein [Streptomyces sp. MC1]MBG7704876.1 hypothetical protein [Streptomyces sp. MC1]